MRTFDRSVWDIGRTQPRGLWRLAPDGKLITVGIDEVKSLPAWKIVDRLGDLASSAFDAAYKSQQIVAIQHDQRSTRIYGR